MEGVAIEMEPTLEQEIWKGQIEDAKIQEIIDQIAEGKVPEFTRIIWFETDMCTYNIHSPENYSKGSP